jgi:hypothetical protein
VADPSRASAAAYTPPTALEDLHILDFLELAGSQAKAGAALAMHQSTVCRSVQLMQQQFRLLPRQGSSVCRHGHNPCLQHLRLAYREHRLMEGLLRIGTDVLHQTLLIVLAGVQQVPPRFRNAEQWAELVRHGLLDGALVSSFALEKRRLSGQAPQWDGLVAMPLGQVALQLVATTPESRRVLLPKRAVAPLLHQTMEQQGYSVEPQPAACQEVEAWIKRARDRRLALLVCPDLLSPSWLQRHGLQPLREQPVLVEQLWLLLPQGTAGAAAGRAALQGLRRQLDRSETMQDLHENQS